MLGFIIGRRWRHLQNPSKIQILTIEDLFNGKQVEKPSDSIAFKQAEKFTKNSDQGALI